MNKQELFDFFIAKKRSAPILDRKGIQKYDIELYNEILKFEEEHYLNNNMKYSEILYCYLKDYTEKPKCYCGKETKFKQFCYGYFDYCGTKCSSNSYEKKEAIKKTNLERYGHENIAHGKEISAKIKANNLEKYGVEYSGGSKEALEKQKRTNLERYGVEYTVQSEEVKEKIRETNKQRYGFESAMKSEIIRDKVKGYWENKRKADEENINDFREYKRLVRYYTNVNYEKYKDLINPDGLSRSVREYNVDHIYPIYEGWKNGVCYKDISNPYNLQMMDYMVNRSKGKRTDLSLEEFYDMINKQK